MSCHLNMCEHVHACETHGKYDSVMAKGVSASVSVRCSSECDSAQPIFVGDPIPSFRQMSATARLRYPAHWHTFEAPCPHPSRSDSYAANGSR